MTDDFDQLFNTATAFAHHYKEAALGEAIPVLLALRECRPVAYVTHPDVHALDRVNGLVAGGYVADALAYIYEATMPLVDFNPVTNAAWQPGETEDVWRHHDGVANGWVSEVQAVVFMTRDLRSRVAATQFTRVRSDISWGEEVGPARSVGAIDGLRDAFGHPIIDPSMLEDGEVADHMKHIGRVGIEVGLTRSLDTQLSRRGNRRGGAAMVFSDIEAAQSYQHEGLMSWQWTVFNPRTN